MDYRSAPAAGLLLLSIFTASRGAIGEDEHEGEEGAIEYLEELRASRVDLNRAGREELMAIPGITASVAARIVQVRLEAGGYRSPADLVRYGAISEELYRVVVPYLQISSEIARQGEELSIRMREVAESPDGRGGSMERGRYFRARWGRGEFWKAGFLIERDTGESEALTGWKGSMMHRTRKGPLDRVSVGHLSVEFSRGLLFFTRSRFDQRYLMNGSVGRRGRGVGFDLSAADGLILQGLGLDMVLPSPATLTLLAASTPLDASRDGRGAVTSIRPSSDRSLFGGDLRLITLAGYLDWRFSGNGSFGVLLADLRYSEPLSPPVDGDHRHELRGSEQRLLGFDLDMAVSGLGLTAEGGLEIGRGFGLLLGLERGSGPARWSVLFRHFAPDFHAPFGNPYHDASGPPTNEQGFFTGAGARVGPDVRLSVYVDTSRRLWRRPQEAFPAWKADLGIEGKWRPGKGVWVTFRGEDEMGFRGVSGEILPVNRMSRTNRFRFQLEWEDDPVEFRGRYELAVYEAEGEEREYGDLLLFDSRYHPMRPLTLDLWVGFFGARTIHSAVYAYVRGLPGAMSVVPLVGEGFRWYLTGQYRLGNDLSISFKLGQATREPDEDGGEGGVAGTQEWSFGLQFDYTPLS